MRKIVFYKNKGHRSPVEDFLDTLTDKQVKKVLWILRIIRDFNRIPIEYFKKLKNTNDIWEARIGIGSDEIRILSFWEENDLIILTNGFRKKDQKTPKTEIEIAHKRKREYLERE